MTNLSNSLYPWYVYAKLNSTSNSSSIVASLILQDKATIDDDGLVKFEKLGISIAESNLKLEYYLDKPFGINEYNY